MSFRDSFRATAVVALCVVGTGAGWYFRPSADPSKAPDSGRKRRGEVVAVQSEEIPRERRELRITGNEGEAPLRVALDEVCLRSQQGREKIERLEPPATSATLAARLREYAPDFEALPVAYPEGEERNEANRRVVTRKLRVRIPAGDAGPVAEANGLQVTERPDYTPEWVIMSAADPLAALDAVDGLRSMAAVSSADVLLARKRFAKAMPNDPLVGSQWHLKKTSSSSTGTDINVESAWQYNGSNGMRGSGIRIGIVDDGLQTSHPDLADNVDPDNDYDFNENDAYPEPDPVNEDFHGTACAGVAAARGNNGLGVSGVAPEAKLVGLRLIAYGVDDSTEAAALNHKRDIIDIKSNSWGPSDYDKRLEEPESLTRAALANAATTGRGGKGTIFTWAAGNGKERSDFSNFDGYANSIYVIAVGAIDSLGRSSSYSESGANVLICAPSDGAGSALGITTTDLAGADGYDSGNYTSTFGGTSSATPVISGVAALLLERNPELGWRDVQEILFRSATKIQPSDSGWKTNGAGFSFNNKFGGGLVNAAAAVSLAANWKPLPAFTSFTSTQTNSIAIPENSSTGATRSFVFDQTYHRVEKVTVKLNATHSSRGNLAVSLRSPSGTVSQLTEVRDDTADNYLNWTFSSVQHWGELAAGTWTLKVEDLSSSGNTVGGSLGSTTLTLFGASTAPVNTAPVVKITSPSSGQVFSPGVPVIVTATASDLATDGSPGVVSLVQLLVDNVPAGATTVPPYQFSVTPANGIHSLTVRALDSEGLAGTSAAISITIADQTPAITAVALSATAQAYADQPLAVSSIAAADPEGTALTYSYQWQSSSDQVNYTNVSGQTAATLPVAAGNAGKLWRCLITASDGTNSSSVFTSASVNLLARPLLVAKTGAAYSYTSGLVLKGVQQTVSRQAIINEFSQGVATGETREWIEILTLQQGSLANWRLKDSSTNYIGFNSNALWSNVPAGTLIVIYNGGGTRDAALPTTDDLNASDGRIVVGSNNATYFSTSAWITLENGGDSISLLNSSLTAVHSLCYGSFSSVPLNVGTVGAGRAAYFTGGEDTAANLAANWTTSAANGGVTPGSPNNASNESFIVKLRTNTLTTPSVFRIGEGSDLPAGLTLNASTGVLSGTIGSGVATGEHWIVIERYNSLGEVVSQSFSLRVYPATYSQWIAGFPVASALGAADPDADGLPNLIEYMLDTNPDTAGNPSAVTFASDSSSISLTYRKSTVPTDANLVAEWSTGLDSATVWQTSGITETVLEQDDRSKVVRSSLAIVPGEPKRFLRLRSATTP